MKTDLIYKQKLPSEVVSEYVEEAIKSYGSLSLLAKVTGLDPGTITNIQKCNEPGVPVGYCDILSIHNNFSLDEITEKAIEWAENNKEANWPDSDKYAPDNRRRSQKVKA